MDERIDVCDFDTDKNAPIAERAEEYINHVKNPYAFRCGDISVNVEFAKNGKVLEAVLTDYLKSIYDKKKEIKWHASEKRK